MTDVWFKGSVAEAVQTVTKKKLVFLVFIYGNLANLFQLWILSYIYHCVIR